MFRVLFVPSPKCCCCFLGFLFWALFILPILSRMITWVLTTYDPATDEPHLSAPTWYVSRASETANISRAYRQLHTQYIQSLFIGLLFPHSLLRFFSVKKCRHNPISFLRKLWLFLHLNILPHSIKSLNSVHLPFQISLILVSFLVPYHYPNSSDRQIPLLIQVCGSA